jgi:hypothetical protein
MRIAGAVQVLAAMVLCGIGAEVLSGYAAGTGDPGAVAVQLVFFAALYGAPAVLVRDLVRRAGWGWPSLLVLCAALGLVQAGLIDQSLFAVDYGGYDGWEQLREPTLIPALGISAFMLHAFVIGHVLFSFAAPLALAEAWIPSRAHRPWLGRLGTAVAVLAYLVVAAMILSDPGSRSATPAQLVVTAVAVAGLVLLAVVLGRRRGRVFVVAADGAQHEGTSRGEQPAPRPPRRWPVLLGALLASLVMEASPPTWIGLALSAAAVAALGLALLRVSRRPGWTVRHVAAGGLGLLLGRGLLAFTTTPLTGEVDQAAKLGHNVVMLGVVLVAGAVAMRPRAVRRRR